MRPSSRLATLTLLLAFGALVPVLAQPQVAYIIPDIGTPGMNTYVEFIAPRNGQILSGGGLFINSGNETISIQPNNIADTSRVLVGPIVVSWDGRLASTQVFVKPGAALGTVPLRVTIGTTPPTSTVVNFEIVLPQTLGTGGRLTGGGALGNGTATFGTRSKRGAMIVDSLSLEGGTYTVSTIDCDPTTPGEQGYLPFILIAKRGLRIASDANLNVSANGLTGGPGGGGGGGEVCDRDLLGGPSGSSGGAGYTGGGGGGRNSSGLGSGKIEQSPGSGTGSSAPDALSGAPGGGNSYTTSEPEATGGGTGHPFGTGGRGSTEGSSHSGNGGGGGNGQTQAGGSAGYSGSGNGSQVGLIHGNNQIVPLAGGSGGASGNPQGLGRCGGGGGGGGGAAAVFSMTQLDIFDAILANGANGGAGQAAGGSGSGGGIIIGERQPFGNGGSISCAGGQGSIPGGAGRYRFDGQFLLGPNPAGGPSSYNGPSMEPLDTVKTSSFTVKGTYNGSDGIKVYMKSPGSVWVELTGITRTGRNWSAPITVTAPGLYAFMVGQEVASPNTGTFTAEPIFVMSQVGANMVQVDFIPRIDVDSTRLTFGQILCPGDTLYDTLQVGNSGDLALNVTPSITGANPLDFSVVAPAGPFTVPPKDTLPLIVRFVPTSNGAKTANLVLTNNDPRPGKNPTVDTLFGSAQLAIRSLTSTSLDFGLICADSAITLPDTLLYEGAGSVTFAGSISGSSPFTFASSPNNLAGAQGSAPFTVSFTPGGTSGTFTDTLFLLTAPCGDTLWLFVRGRANRPAISITPDPLVFGSTRVTSSTTLPITVTNNGTDTATVTGAFFTTGTPPFTLVGNPIGTRIAGGGSSSVSVQYAPTVLGADSGHLCLVVQSGCTDTICIDLRGTAVDAALVTSRPQLVLRTDSCTETPGQVVDTLKLYNMGGASEQITSILAARGLFTATTAPAVPGTLAGNDSILITVAWTPGATALDTLVINTGSTDPAQRVLRVPVQLVRNRAAYAITLSNGDTLPPLLDFGDLFACSPNNNRTFLIRNIGTLRMRVSARMLSGTAFNVTQPAAITVDSGTTGTFTVVFAPATPGRFNDTLVVIDSSCNREVRLPMTGVGATLTFTATSINFGTSNVGTTRTGTARLDYQTNPTSTTRAIVDSVVVVPSAGSAFAITGNPTPTNLLPGEGASVDVGFTPTAQTGFSAQLCFYVSQPCDTVICVPLNGFGVQSGILVRQRSINYGTLAYCRDSVQTLVILNSGSAALNILDLLLGGVNPEAFEQITSVTFPATVNPGDSLVVEYRFTPGQSTGNGTKTATVQITSNDPIQPVLTVDLIGERRRQVLTTPSTLDFGAVEQGTTVEDTITLENRTNEPISVGTFTLGAPFLVEGTLPPSTLPTTIAPGDSLRVRVSFTPSDTTLYTDSLLAAIAGPCADTSSALVTGRGFKTQSGGATITIPATLSGAPGNRLAIPILLSDARLLNESGAHTIRLTLRFNGTLLVPTRARSKGEPMSKSAAATAGTLLSNRLIGHDRVVQLELKNDPNPAAPDTLGFLDVVVALGDSISTPIRIDTAFWVDGTVTTLTESGAFTLDSLCLVGPRRLVHVENFGIKRVTPNPVRGSATLEIATVESGGTSLQIYDLTGRSVTTLLDRVSLTPGTHTVEWNTTALPSGLYQVVLVSPTQRNVISVVVAQ